MIWWYLIWKREAFKAAKENEIEILAKSNTDNLLETLIEVISEGVKAIMEGLKLVAQSNGVKFLG